MKEQRKYGLLRLLVYALAILTILFAFYQESFFKEKNQVQEAGWVCGVSDAYSHLDQSAKQGRKLFKIYCASCHKIEKLYHGVPFQAIRERREEHYLIDFTLREDSLIKAGNKDAIRINEQFKDANVDHNFKFKEEDVQMIFDYVDQQ